MAEVMSVPATSGQPPKISFDGFQSLVKMKEKTPWWASAGRALLQQEDEEEGDQQQHERGDGRQRPAEDRIRETRAR